MIHALRTHAKRTLAAAFAAAFALGSALTLSACSGKPAKQTGSNSTLVPQTEVPTVSATATPAPAETATPFIDPTDPPATPVPVVGEYTKPCQKVKVDFPATDSTRAFSVTFDLPEGWTVRSDEGVYTDSSYSDFGFNLHGRKLLYDENGNLAGAVGFHFKVPRGMRSMDTVRLSLPLLWDTSNTSTGIIIILWTVILQTARVCIPFRITEFHPLHG